MNITEQNRIGDGSPVFLPDFLLLGHTLRRAFRSTTMFASTMWVSLARGFIKFF